MRACRRLCEQENGFPFLSDPLGVSCSRGQREGEASRGAHLSANCSIRPDHLMQEGCDNAPLSLKEAEPTGQHSFGAYFSLLHEREAYRVLWLGELVNDLGSWFNYVGALSVVEELAPGQTMLLSLALIMRMLPSALLFPVAGVVADRYDKVRVMMVINLAAAGLVSACALVRTPGWLWLLFVLTFGQASTNAFYDPAKRALTPSLVTARELPLATALDTVGWSVVGAFGSALGGLGVSRLGAGSCFLLDGATYLFAAWQATQLAAVVPLAARYGVPGKGSTAGLALTADCTAGGSVPEGATSGALVAEGEEDLENQPLLVAGTSTASSSGTGSALHSRGLAGPPSSSTPSGWRYVLQEAGKEVVGMKEGWDYMWATENRDIAVLVFLKGSGGLLWGASDVLNVRFSDSPAMQGLGDASTTLGLLFSAVAFGCFIGPVAYNWRCPHRPQAYLASAASTFWLLLGGYLLMGVAGNIWTLLPSVVVRSCGSAVLWTYSSLLLQVRADGGFLGRVLALEMAIYTLLISASVSFGGFATESLHLSIHGLIGIMSGLTTTVAVVWSVYAWRCGRKEPQEKGEADREGSPQEESSPGDGRGPEGSPVVSRGLPLVDLTDRSQGRVSRQEQGSLGLV